MILIFSTFWLLKKNFRGLPMDEIGGFSFKKTSCLALHLYEIGPSGVPVNEMVLVLVSPFLKAVFMESILAEQTSGNFSLTNSIRSFWNHLNWFPWDFLNENNFLGIFHHETDFQENFQNKLVAWFSHQHVLFSRSCKKIKTFFFDFPDLKKVFSEFSLLELIFFDFSVGEISFRGFSVNEVLCGGFLLNEKIFWDFQ